MLARRMLLWPRLHHITTKYHPYNRLLVNWSPHAFYSEQEQRRQDDTSREVSNITNVLNELNDEKDFDSSRRVIYRTTASQLVEKMKSLSETAAENNEARPVAEDENGEEHLKEDANVQEDKVQVAEMESAPDIKVNIENVIKTHEIYKQLREADFDEKQLHLIMGLVMHQLQLNVDKLRAQYSPMLDLDNENYLFQALQQELKSEMSSCRESDLNLLVNSSILLKRSFQSLDDELVINYKLMDNSVKLEMNQFKHENNLHNKQLDLKNQDLNNKIVTDLVGDLRSYTESLRWQLTRSALMTIFIMVFLCITSYTIIKNADDDDVEVVKPDHGSKKIVEKITNDRARHEEEEEAELQLDER